MRSPTSLADKPRYGAWALPAYQVNTLSHCDETTEFQGPISGEAGQRRAPWDAGQAAAGAALRGAQAVPYRVTNEADGIVNAELAHDAAPMGFRRFDADIQQAGHLSRAVALRDQL